MTPTFSLSYTRPMINSRIPVLLALLVLLVGGRHVQAQENQKLAQTGMKFLSMSHDPRAAAMADAVTSVEGLTSALFYNPAAMSRQRNFINVMAGQTQWIAGIDHQHATLTMAPSNGRWGVFGFSIQSANYGDMQETVRWDNEQGFIDLGTFSPSAYAIGFGYARAITDRFSVGGQVKYANQDLGATAMERGEGSSDFVYQDNSQGVMAFDFGVLYQTGFESLNLAMSVRNFAQEIRYEDENFQLPLNFHIGISMDAIDLTSADPRLHSLLVSVNAERPRDYSEMVQFGAEYAFINTFMVRGGYTFLIESAIRENSEEGVSLGAGLRYDVAGVGFGADYAYTTFGVFADVHRIALQFSF